MGLRRDPRRSLVYSQGRKFGDLAFLSGADQQARQATVISGNDVAGILGGDEGHGCVCLKIPPLGNEIRARMTFLRENLLFAHRDENMRYNLAGAMTVIDLPPGESVTRHVSRRKGNFILAIQSGELKVDAALEVKKSKNKSLAPPSSRKKHRHFIRAGIALLGAGDWWCLA